MPVSWLWGEPAAKALAIGMIQVMASWLPRGVQKPSSIVLSQTDIPYVRTAIGGTVAGVAGNGLTLLNRSDSEHHPIRPAMGIRQPWFWVLVA